MPIRDNVFAFNADLKAFAKAMDTNVREAQRIAMFELFQRIVQKTPVDTGRAAGSWNIGFQQEANAEGVGAEASMARLAAMNTTNLGVYLITNNVPYIGVLEFGGYPNPPQEGTGKTVDGYSKQAPVGMCRISIAELEAEIDSIIKKAGVK